ncbi:MAG: sugar kinase [Proteobacteria bacterium]|nr:sugar kinase [Pseudomonadota bacterium]
MVTWDVVYRSRRYPEKNEKMMADDLFLASGGPAGNAAVAFAALGNRAVLQGSVGRHPMAKAIRQDLENQGVVLSDLTPERSDPPPISSIIVDNTTGERAVMSVNAPSGADASLPVIEMRPDVILADGHQIDAAIAAKRNTQNCPLVIDGGSWKDGLEKLLKLAEYALCSADFFPPGCEDYNDVLAYLSSLGVPFAAITNGPNPIRYITDNGTSGTIQVPTIDVVDTMGAGDIFHGAFCHFVLKRDFASAITSAAEIASLACAFFGTRTWITHYPS